MLYNNADELLPVHWFQIVLCRDGTSIPSHLVFLKFRLVLLDSHFSVYWDISGQNTSSLHAALHWVQEINSNKPKSCIFFPNTVFKRQYLGRLWDYHIDSIIPTRLTFWAVSSCCLVLAIFCLDTSLISTNTCAMCLPINVTKVTRYRNKM